MASRALAYLEAETVRLISRNGHVFKPRRVKLFKRLGSSNEAGRRGVLDSGSAGEL